MDPAVGHRWLPDEKVWDCEREVADLREALTKALAETVALSAALSALVDWAGAADIELTNEGVGPDGTQVIAAAKALLPRGL